MQSTIINLKPIYFPDSQCSNFQNRDTHWVAEKIKITTMNMYIAGNQLIVAIATIIKG